MTQKSCRKDAGRKEETDVLGFGTPSVVHRFATGALCEPRSDLLNWKAWGRSRESGFSEPPGHSAAS